MADVENNVAEKEFCFNIAFPEEKTVQYWVGKEKPPCYFLSFGV